MMNIVPSSAATVTSSQRKALQINLDKSIYGTFAEIGAGQEVARHFFYVGGAAGTVAKSISAYDMTFSDEIYGKTARYVSRERLVGMLDHEYRLLLERLSVKQGAETTFFVFANSVAARNYKGTNECHGWMAIRFQHEPLSPPNDIIMHVRMIDDANVMQQQALGIIGVNLIYGAYFYRSDPEQFIKGLLDELTIERIEVDMIEFSGPALTHLDNRLMSLKLLENGLTNAILLAADQKILQPSEVLRKKPILVMRGSFRPITNLNLDMTEGALEQFKNEPSVKDKQAITLFEITLKNLLEQGSVDYQDILARADIISSLGYMVLITNYPEYYRLTGYLRRYTQELIGMALGIDILLELYNQKYYESLSGGLLEALGRLFKGQVKLYAYPMTREDFTKFSEQHLSIVVNPSNKLPAVVDLDSIQLIPLLHGLYTYVRGAGYIDPIVKYNEQCLQVESHEVLQAIQSGDKSWEAFVPGVAAGVIKQRKVFGFKEVL